MDYTELMAYVIGVRDRMDRNVENILRLNGDSTLLRVGKPVLSVKRSGDDTYQHVGAKSFFVDLKKRRSKHSLSKRKSG
jgi:hypothetical protein